MAPFLFGWRAAFKSAPELISSDRHVLHVVADHMNEHGEEAWPSIAKIVRETALKRDTVCSSLQWIQRAGWLTTRRTSRRQSTRYTAVIPVERQSRADRTEWVKRRRERLALLRASSPKRGTTQPSETGNHSADLSSPKSALRVVRNGNSESSEMGTHELFLTSPKNSPNPKTLSEASYVENGDEIQTRRMGDQAIAFWREWIEGGQGRMPAHLKATMLGYISAQHESYADELEQILFMLKPANKEAA